MMLGCLLFCSQAQGPKQRGAEQEDALALASQILGGSKNKDKDRAVAPPSGGKSDTEKKLKNLRKVGDWSTA